MHHIPQPLQKLLDGLEPALSEHVQRVRQVAQQLAHAHGVDPLLADLAAACHDILRLEPPHKLLSDARSAGLSVHPVEESLPILLHGPVAAHLLPTLGVSDPRVVEAVRWHSTAAPAIGPLARLMYLADKLDPHKIAQDSTMKTVGQLALKELDTAVLRCLELELIRLLRQGKTVHPASVEARNELLFARARGSEKS